MNFQNIQDIEEALHSSALSVRELYQVWEQRQPIPDSDRYRSHNASSTYTRQIAWFQQDIALARVFTKHALAKEEFLLVWDAAREILRLWPTANESERTELVRVRMDYAAALTRLGFTRDARRELEPCVDAAFQPMLGRKLKVDILLQLGHILREESYQTAAKAVQLKAAEEALGFYQQALKLEPERLEALVLTASTSLILGDEGTALRDQSHETARHILRLTKKLEDENGPRFETTWAQATAHTVLGDVEAAASSYGDLHKMHGATTTDLAEARFRAQFLAEALDQPRDLFKSAFPPLQLIVFAGHLPDLPGGRMRFPPESVGAVREALRAQLDAVHARVGLASAAAGADLIFIEALRERSGDVHLILPWSREEFLRTSVNPFEPPEGSPIWEPLFKKAIEEAATIREVGQVYEPGSDVGWEYLKEVTAGIALHTARTSRLDLQPMVLWDGLPGYGAGGTDSFYSFWRNQLQIEPIIVKPPAPSSQAALITSERRSKRCEHSIMHQEVKSMLFADIVGYSKLTEKVIPEFVGTFLERVSRLAAERMHAPCSVNTWGDAVYAVFDSAHDAGCFALELAQMVQKGESDWLQKGLYWEEQVGDSLDVVKHPLNIRTGLHTGPVVMIYDPVVRRIGFTGTHVNRAARIEPVAKPGEVFASEEFAAMAELGREIQIRKGAEDVGSSSGAEQSFVCEYAGSMQLAKGYPGRHRIYRVLKRQFDLEELAREAHEGYCAESRAHGDTPETNSSLRPWEELPEDLKEANRAQVADIPNKLRLLGYELAPNRGIHPSEITMTAADVEDLAIREHERWMSDRQRHGWTYAPKRDNSRKRHNLLILWDQLSEREKEKDRDTIRNLPRLVERAGVKVRRVAQKS
jgi:class 3 adenylate cyclase